MRSTITLPFPHTSHFFIILAAPKFEALGHRERKEGFPFSMSLVFDNFVKFFTEENGLF